MYAWRSGQVASKFLPSAVRFTYNWNMRELANVFQGMCQVRFIHVLRFGVFSSFNGGPEPLASVIKSDIGQKAHDTTQGKHDLHRIFHFSPIISSRK